jgi:hypothetical protein
MRKAAKVYEAGESVEGNKPKVVYESHKKCTPGEFGARVKESTATIGGASVAGAGLGALLGALRAPKGKMLKYTLGGAGIGGLAGAGSAAGYNLIPNRDYDGPTSLAKLPLALGGGALAGHLGNKLYDEVEEYIPEKKDKKQEKKQEKEAAGSGGVLGRFLAAAATVGGAGAALNSAAKKRLPPTGNTPPINTPTIAENAAARRREIDGLIKANSAHEFGQKAAAGGMWGKALGMASKAMGAVPAAATATSKTLAQTPNQAAQKAMLAARSQLKPQPGQMRLSSGQRVSWQQAPGAPKGVGGFANDSAPMVRNPVQSTLLDPQNGYVPRRDALAAVGARAANRHALKQIGVVGGLSAGNVMLNSALQRAQQPEPVVSPAMKNLFQNMRPAEAPAADSVTVKANSAREFGQKLAFNIDLSMFKDPTIGGAALGAVAGGVHGLINPGEDENGKTRSRFGAMLRGALGGGALGTAGGAAIGHFAPNLPRDIYNFGRRTLTGKNQAQLNMADNVSAMTPQQQALHARAMQPFRKPKSITEQFPEEISFPQQQ